jgi:hypothetical protein
LPRLEVVDWPALRDCQVTHDAAAGRLEGLDPERAPAQFGEADSEVRGIVEVAVLALDRLEGEALLADAGRRLPPVNRAALERDRRRLRRLFDETLAPRVDYLGQKVAPALVEVHEAETFEAVAA